MANYEPDYYSDLDRPLINTSLALALEEPPSPPFQVTVPKKKVREPSHRAFNPGTWFFLT